MPGSRLIFFKRLRLQGLIKMRLLVAPTLFYWLILVKYFSPTNYLYKIKKHKTSQIIVLLTITYYFTKMSNICIIYLCFLSSRNRYRSGISLRLRLRFFLSGYGSEFFFSQPAPAKRIQKHPALAPSPGY